MSAHRDPLTDRELRAYAVVQGVCLFPATASMSTFLRDLPLVMKWVAFAMSVAFMLACVVFNYARRFGVRVVWSHRLRDRI